MDNRIPQVVDEEDPNYAEKTWKILEEAINEMYNHNACGFNAEESKRFVFVPPFISFASSSVSFY